MGIGTSLGAYFEDDFKHESGVQEEVVKPKETGDNNVVTPDRQQQNKSLEDVEMKQLGGIEIGYKPDDTPDQKEEKNFFQRLSLFNSLKGMMNPSVEEDVNMLKHTWSALKLPGDVMKGEIDPSSPDAIHKAFYLAGLIALPAGGLKGRTVKMEALKAQQQAEIDNIIGSFETARSGGFRGRQGAAEVIPPSRDTRTGISDPFEQTPFTRNLTDQELLRYVEENPGVNLDRSEHVRYRSARDNLPTLDFVEHLQRRNVQGGGYPGISEPQVSLVEAFDQQPKAFAPKMAERIADAKAKKELNFFETPQERAYGKHYFASEKGVGEMNVSYSPSKKTIKVHNIGIIENAQGNKISNLSYESFKQGPQAMGYKETKQILKYLKETYPEAEWISGFRVSGARAKSGDGSANAKMWIGKGPNPTKQSKKTLTAEDYRRMTREYDADTQRQIDAIEEYIRNQNE